MAGASISKVLWVMCLQCQDILCASEELPVSCHFKILGKVKNKGSVVWSGDGRFDSMGHSAKYGAYTMFCNTVLKVVHFELLQVSGNISIT